MDEYCNKYDPMKKSYHYNFFTKIFSPAFTTNVLDNVKKNVEYWDQELVREVDLSFTIEN